MAELETRDGATGPEPAQVLSIRLSVNGEHVSARVPARQHLADFLRDTLELRGTRLGCEHGFCGACTVRLDGAIVRGCLLLAAQADGAAVETVEGLDGGGEFADLQRAFAEHNALQCGYCTAGMLLTAAALLEDPRPLTRAEIREHLSGNYCRCTGYQAIVDAIAATLTTRLRRTGR